MSNNLCICAWPDCITLRDNIRKIAPASHVWCSPNIRIQFPSLDVQDLSLKKYALRQAIFKHIPIRHTFCLSSQKNLFIAPHHFPICLLQWRIANNIVAFTKLISLSDLGDMDDTNNDRQYLKEDCNSARKMMRNHRAYDTTKFANMYVQSPISTRSAVTLFLKSSRRRVVVRRTSSPVTPRIPSTNDDLSITIPPFPIRDNITPTILNFNTTPPPLHSCLLVD